MWTLFELLNELLKTKEELKYGVAKGVGNAASMVTDWYLKQAMALFPTISIGSGSSVWIILTDDVLDVPTLDSGEFL